MPWKHQSDVRLSCSGLVEALCVCSAAGRASLRDHNEAKERSPSELPVSASNIAAVLPLEVVEISDKIDAT